MVDVLVFNPPYVPTVEGGDSWAGELGFAWAGGGMGMKTTWRVLDELAVDSWGLKKGLIVGYIEWGRSVLFGCCGTE